MKKLPIFYTDGGVANNGDYGHQQAVVCACDQKGTSLFFTDVGDKTNNEAELLAILTLLQTTKKKQLIIFSDSQLAIHLIDKTWHTKIDRLLTILQDIWSIKKSFRLIWIPREENKAGWIIQQTLGL